MRKLLSWRWSRLTVSAAWKRLLKWDVLLGGIFTGIAYAVLLSMLSVKTAGIICLCCIIVFAFGILAELCCADDFFFVGYDEKLCKVYVYKTKDTLKRVFYDIHIKEPEDIAFISAAEYEYEIFRGGRDCFIFRGVDDDLWYHFADTADGTQIRELGKRLGKTVFLAPSSDEKTERLQILYADTCQEFEVESYVYKDIYLPLSGDEKIVQTGDRDFNQKTLKYRPPYDFLLLKRLGSYELISLYADECRGAGFLFTSAPAVMFRAGIETVVLLAEKDGRYREFYRGESFIPIKNGNILELDCGVPMSGRILRFNPETKTLETQYEGRITSIGFQDGQVGIGNGRILRL